MIEKSFLRRLFSLGAILLFLCNGALAAEEVIEAFDEAAEQAEQQKAQQLRKTQKEEKAAEPEEVEKSNKTDEAPYYKYRVVTSVGMNVIRSMGWGFGAQLGYNPNRGSWYFGPEAHFSLFVGGSILETLIGAWNEVRISGTPRLGVSIGALAGAGFASRLPNIPNTALIAMLDLDISHEIDELTAVRGQFRPGIVGNYFSFMMLLGVTFRFK